MIQEPCSPDPLPLLILGAQAYALTEDWKTKAPAPIADISRWVWPCSLRPSPNLVGDLLFPGVVRATFWKTHIP